MIRPALEWECNDGRTFSLRVSNEEPPAGVEELSEYRFDEGPWTVIDTESEDYGELFWGDCTALENG